MNVAKKAIVAMMVASVMATGGCSLTGTNKGNPAPERPKTHNIQKGTKQMNKGQKQNKSMQKSTNGMKGSKKSTK